MFDLGGKVALVTGGNGGLGLGMAQGLARAGARVAIAARNPEKSAAAVETLKALGSDSFAVAIDVADEASVRQAVDAVAARHGRLDILVNNAGITGRKPVDQLTLDEWNLVLQTNLTSAFLVSRAAHPHMQRAGGGKRLLLRPHHARHRHLQRLARHPPRHTIHNLILRRDDHRLQHSDLFD